MDRFVANGKCEFGWVPKKMVSEKYWELLETIMIEHRKEFCRDDFMFQQKNEAILSSKKVKVSFKKRYKFVSEPDLNPL